MSASQSVLDTSRYNYDVVVATTQYSINATMKQYYTELTAPVARMCYVGDPNNPKLVTYDELMDLSRDTDPFTVPDGTDPETSKDLANLEAAGFVYGFRLQLGLPQVPDPADTPDIVKLGMSAANVTFYLLSADLDVVGFSSGTGKKTTWTNVQQADTPWIFTCAADLRMENVPAAKYGTLPQPVQQAIKNLTGSAFSIKQLLLDLSTAVLLAIPDIPGVPDTINTMLQKYFVDVYMNQLRTAIGNPVLSCAITQQAQSADEMTITDMNLEVSPCVGADGSPVANPTPAQQNIATLDYLCATDNHPLSAPRAFTWNWIDDAEKDDYDGVVAINRRSFVQKIQDQMLANVRANCYKPYVNVSLDWTLKATFKMNVTPGGEPAIDQGAVSTGIPGRDLQVLKFSYHGHDSDQANPSWYGTASLDTYYDATVYFSGSKITVEQNQKFDMRVTRTGSTTSGTPISIKRVDTCELDVGDYGELIAIMATPTPAENHATESAGNMWQDMWGQTNSLYSSTAAVVAGTAGTMLNTLPFAVFQYFVFPGGQTFSYSSVGFAQLGDMISHIVYADPDSVTPDMSLLPGQVQGSDRLNDGQWLANDGYLVSDSGNYAAYLQDDGNFVLLHANNGIPDLSRPYWSVFANATNKIVGKFTGTPCLASMQSDGNFVLYNGKTPLSAGPPYWAINAGLPQLGTFAAVIKDSGDFIVYKRDPKSSALGEIVWAAGAPNAAKQ